LYSRYLDAFHLVGDAGRDVGPIDYRRLAFAQGYLLGHFPGVRLFGDDPVQDPLGEVRLVEEGYLAGVVESSPEFAIR
jgi:hypothetical protein